MARKKHSSRKHSVTGILPIAGVETEPVDEARKQAPDFDQEQVEDKHSIGGKDEQPSAPIKKIYSKKQRIFIYSVMALASITIFATALFAWLSHNSFIRANIAGVGVHNNTSQDQLAQAIESKAKDYKIHVVNQTVKSDYSLTDAGIAVNADESAAKALLIKKPANLLQRVQFWKNESIALVLQVDDIKFNDFTKQHMTQVTKPAENANIILHDNGAVTVADEKVGEAYTVKDVSSAVRGSVATLENKTFTLELQTLQPDISTKDLSASKEKVSSLMSQKITFTISGQTVSAKPADIKQWIEITPVPANKTADVNINSGKILSYINRIAKPYVQPPVTQIMMTDPNGEQQVLVAGRSGVDIVNKETVAADLAKKVTEGTEPLTIDLPVKYASYKTINAQPHDKWLVVDVTTKRMYAYEQTNLVRTFLISAGAPQTPTVIGEYKIYRKNAKQDMRGANADGSRYFQPNVQWVNYFYADYAIHGNYWRPTSYFGNINSSHGCVGIVNSDAKWIYDWAPVGTTVIVHK